MVEAGTLFNRFAVREARFEMIGFDFDVRLPESENTIHEIHRN